MVLCTYGFYVVFIPKQGLSHKSRTNQTVHTIHVVNTDSNCHTGWQGNIFIVIVGSIFIEIRNGWKSYLLQNIPALQWVITTAV